MKLELEPARVLAATLPAGELPRFLGDLREIEATALARLAAPAPAPQNGNQGERLLTVEEAAERLGTSKDYLYRHHRHLPFARKFDFGLRFSQSALNAYIRNARK